MIAGLVVAGAGLTRLPAAAVIALMAVGFVLSLLPRITPRADALRLPALMAFAYSAAFPLAEAPVSEDRKSVV